MRKLRILTDVNTDQQNSGCRPRWFRSRNRIALGHHAANDRQHPVRRVRPAQVSTMYTPLNQYHVVMEVAPQFWQDPASLNDIYIRPTNGQRSPAQRRHSLRADEAPLSVNHQGQFPSVTLSFNLAPGSGAQRRRTAIDQMQQKMGVPSTIHGMFSGTPQAFQSRSPPSRF